MTMIPSIKTLMNLRDFTNQPITRDQAKHIRRIMHRAVTRAEKRLLYPQSSHRGALAAIDAILNGCGVERIEQGSNRRSPAIDYVNMGDTYDTTVMVVRGRFRVGCWGDIVERGNYS